MGVGCDIKLKRRALLVDQAYIPYKRWARSIGIDASVEPGQPFGQPDIQVACVWVSNNHQPRTAITEWDTRNVNAVAQCVEIQAHAWVFHVSPFSFTSNKNAKL